jgi:predicted enzyme related to lactoylglutathione lyase
MPPDDDIRIRHLLDAATKAVAYAEGKGRSDLDSTHKAALAAGASEVFAPSDVSGMPRTSTVADPDDNRINLHQNA